MMLNLPPEQLVYIAQTISFADTDNTKPTWTYVSYRILCKTAVMQSRFVLPLLRHSSTVITVVTSRNNNSFGFDFVKSLSLSRRTVYCKSVRFIKKYKGFVI